MPLSRRAGDGNRTGRRVNRGIRIRGPFPLPSPLRGEARDGRNRRQDRNGFIGSLRTFAPLDLGLVKSKENGRSRAMHACAKVPAMQPRTTVKPVLQTATISAADRRCKPQFSIFDAFAQAFPLTFRVWNLEIAA